MGLTLRRLVSAAPDLAIAASYLITWLSPSALGARSFKYLTFIMIFEFVVIHSSVFMGLVVAASGLTRPVKAASLIGLGFFYSIFVVGFAVEFGESWAIAAFWMLTLNRLTPVLFGTRPTDDEAAVQVVGWGLSVALYLGCAAAAAFLPMPHFGVTPDVVAANPIPGSGPLAEEPYRFLAWGAAYYVSQGAVELLWDRFQRLAEPRRGS